MNEKISILIPVYNGEKYITRCLVSVINQTVPAYEIVVLDDGSTDSTLDIIHTVTEGLLNFKVIHQENRGLASSRNRLLEESSGDWVCFLDADDFLHPQYLERICNNALQNDADISIINYCRTEEEDVDFSELPTGKATIHSKYSILDAMTKDFRWTVAWGKLIKRDLFDGIVYPDGKIHEDEAVTYKLIYKATKIVTDDSPLYYYYVNPTSITQKKYTKKRLDLFSALEDRIAFFDENNEKELARKHSFLLLSQIWRNYNQAQKEAGDREIPSMLLSYYTDKYSEIKSKYRIPYLLYPELYILICPPIAWLSKLLYKIKHKVERL